MRIGLLAILVGILFLLKNTGYITSLQWDIVWPIILIYLGIAAIARNRCWHCGIWHDTGMFGKKKMHANVCDCDCENCKDCQH